MRRMGWVITLVWLLVAVGDRGVYARQRTQGFCENGNSTVSVAGYTSTTLVQRSYSACTVTVYDAGTTTLALIYSDDAGTQQSNPFTAAASGQWYFYADTGRYDVRFSGAGITTPFTRGDWPSGGILNNYALNFLPLPGNEGALVRLTDNTRGLYLDTGDQWVSVNGSVTNVRDFGAHGNAIADDTAAIQNAVNGLPTNVGGEVFLPCGTYKITAPIALRSRVWIRGSGLCSSLYVSGNINGLVAIGTQATPITFVKVSDLSMVKILGSITTNIAVWGSWAHDMRIERVVVSNTGGVWGVAFNCIDCNRYRLIDGQASGTGTNVISLATTTGVVSASAGIQNHIIGGYYTSNFQGVSLVGQTDFLIDGGVFTNNTSGFAYGIVVEDSTYTGMIRNCLTSGHVFGGIDFEPNADYNEIAVIGCTIRANPVGINAQSGGGTYIGNSLISNTTAGIVLTGGLGSTVVGNQFRGNERGLGLSNSFKYTVTGNVFTNNTTYGVYFIGTQSTNFLSGNVFNSNGIDVTGMTVSSAYIDANPLNLRGAVTISGAATTSVVSNMAAVDNAYRVSCTISTITGAPAAGSTRCYIVNKTTTGFTITLEVAPGVGNSVSVDYVVIR